MHSFFPWLAALGLAGAPAAPFTLSLDRTDGLEALVSKADRGPEVVTFGGRKAVRATQVEAPDTKAVSSALLLLVPGLDFTDGTIEVDVVGRPRAGAPEDVRGFIGVAFRVQGQGDRYECFYIRQTNGRADDQVRRNHSTQYISEPEWGWKRLRDESPGVYESYVDLALDTWTHLRIHVAGTRAELYVGKAPQPVLIVKDLRHGLSHGQVGLWVGSDTEAYFSQLKISR
jgi:hypothetical protein